MRMKYGVSVFYLHKCVGWQAAANDRVGRPDVPGHDLFAFNISKMEEKT